MGKILIIRGADFSQSKVDVTKIPFKCSITVVSNNNDAGVVYGSGTYYEGDEITISAIPNHGYEFLKWEDGDTNSIRTIIIDNNLKMYKAIFVKTYEENIDISDFVQGAVYTSGSNFGSINNGTVYFKRTDYIDIAKYSEKENAKLIITIPVCKDINSYKYGLVFYTKTNTNSVIEEGVTSIIPGDTNTSQIVEIIIPSNAKYFRTTFWTDESYGSGVFSAKVKYYELL